MLSLHAAFAATKPAMNILPDVGRVRVGPRQMGWKIRVDMMRFWMILSQLRDQNQAIALKRDVLK